MNKSFNKFAIRLLTTILFVNTIFHCNNFYALDVLYTEGDMQYQIVDNAIVIIKYIGNESEVTIPYNYGSYEVKAIDSGAFVDSNVTKVTLPDNVSYYDLNVFNNLGIEVTVVNVNGDETHINQDNLTNNNNNHDLTTNNDSDEINEFFEDSEVDISQDFQEENKKIQKKQSNDQNTKSFKLVNDYFNELFDDASSIFNDGDILIYSFIIISSSILVVIIIYYLRNHKHEE